MSQAEIFRAFNSYETPIKKVIEKLRNIIPPPDFSNSKLGGDGFVVQVDETMMNFKCKSHCGRSPDNRTDALYIVEVGVGITGFLRP